MARGELVPDDVVVAIVADRIDQPDARNGFILDGFPRTVPQAEALDAHAARTRASTLDAVVELKVDEDILLDRVAAAGRRDAARGEPVRADDNPEVLKKRLDAYRAQTAPLVDYYRRQGLLKTVDGMAAIADVTGHRRSSRRHASRRKAAFQADGRRRKKTRGKGRRPKRRPRSRPADQGLPRRPRRSGGANQPAEIQGSRRRAKAAPAKKAAESAAKACKAAGRPSEKSRARPAK